MYSDGESPHFARCNIRQTKELIRTTTKNKIDTKGIQLNMSKSKIDTSESSHIELLNSLSEVKGQHTSLISYVLPHDTNI